jgi:hypothetical protein
MDDDAPPEAPAFEAPHSNGAMHETRPTRAHAPWEFLVLTLFVMILCIGIVLGWTFIGSHSPERLDAASATAVSAVCNGAQAQLKALPDPDPRGNGAQRAARVRAENAPLREMVTQMGAVHPKSSTPATALRAWTADWGRMIDARTTYANALAALATSANPNGKVRFIYPAINAIKPITGHMDDFVRENNPHLDACFTEALQIEVVEGPRVYKKVTS